MKTKTQCTRRSSTRRFLLVYSGELSGLRYYHDPDIHARPAEGTELELRREPENAFDSYAGGVFYEGRRLGFIARGPNEVLARMTDGGAELKAVAESHEPGAMHWSCGVGTGVYLVSRSVKKSGGRRCIKLGSNGLGEEKFIYCRRISRKP